MRDTQPEPTAEKDAKSQPAIRRYGLPAILVLGLILFFSLGGSKWLSFATIGTHYEALKAFVSGSLLLACFAYGAVYMMAVAFSLPVALPLTIAGGALLGWVAAPVIIIGATCGASLVFIAARTILSDLLRARAGPFFQKLEAGFRKNDFHYLLAMRLIPAAPFWVVNIVPAFTDMKLSRYVLATAIGIAPGTTVYVSIARGLDHIMASGQTPDLSLLTSPQIILPFVGLGLLALLPVIFNARSAKHEVRHDDPNS